ncbi:thermonuclease family protein [Notoacmeibacter sp. MSK16QG-6]|uniref:thermonuclease family protein n=1 Tax=Notoacmeibacter sp. MSK16QG-6 TaxID=2957982 RepID=UPI00209CFD7E|nr:thermonuclease family protein [Notoacmeibacter sp. MSK16QG-6]MCP1201093.1 thermonuclease family protein [Notoacmeibacter sp. MSK16QG-6]
MNRLALAAVSLLPCLPAFAADPILSGPPSALIVTSASPLPSYSGRVAVIDGRTLWYPQYGAKVRLMDIDACELPQWALDPHWVERDKVHSPPPVPCGPLAKAWLKRAIGSHPVKCTGVAYDADGVVLAYCSTRGYDLGLEMLRVGWARVVSPSPAYPNYFAYQRYAMAARYGMWATYVLDMNEWRRKAVDKTLNRQPIADFNLLTERESEISPPFVDARNKPKRTDR